jgi:rSAM/selenodomain-associated transferase 2
MPEISIIVPVLDDAHAAARLLAGLAVDPTVELILVDGGRDSALDTLAEGRPDVSVIRTVPGRGRQLDAGAAVATGEWLWFLHADSRVPDGWRQVFTSETNAGGGWFRFALDSPTWQARLLERLVRWRVRVFRLPYGDQGLFVRRAVFARLGGFGQYPLMEDVAFARRLLRAGPVAEPVLALTTSARRWERDGWLRRSLRNLSLLALYGAGVSPERLARWYEEPRRR